MFDGPSMNPEKPLEKSTHGLPTGAGEVQTYGLSGAMKFAPSSSCFLADSLTSVNIGTYEKRANVRDLIWKVKGGVDIGLGNLVEKSGRQNGN